MITPDKVRPAGAPRDGFSQDCIALEILCDEAIRRADRTQEWPAPVPVIRQRIGVDAIDAIADRYEAAGWRVNRGGPMNIYFTIDRPLEVR